MPCAEWAGLRGRYLAAGRWPGDHVLRRGAGRLRARVRRSGRRHRLAAGRRRHRLPVPRRARACGRACWSATCWSTTTRRFRSAPRWARRSATCSRCWSRRCCMRRLVPRGAPLASVGGLARHGRRDRRRRGGQRDGRRAVAAPRRRDRHRRAARRSGARGGWATSPARWSSSRSRSPGTGRCRARWPRGRAVEAALLLVAVAGASELAFRSNEPVAYLVFPALIWAALRFGERGATLAVAVAVGFAVWNTTHYDGPFVVRLDHPQRARHAALHRGGGAVHALPRRGGHRARGVRAAACARLARAWSRPPTPSAGGSGATSTTAPSSA